MEENEEEEEEEEDDDDEEEEEEDDEKLFKIAGGDVVELRSNSASSTLSFDFEADMSEAVRA